MLLVFVPKLTNRLGYTLNVVMRDLLQTEFAITNDAGKFLAHAGPRLCYGPYRVGGGDIPYIKSCRLLFETVIEEQQCRCFSYNGLPALFPVFGDSPSLPFDAFAAIFFMVSRYEEYLPHRSDPHGRFPATESTAFQHGFLQTAVVDRWAQLVRDLILRHYPDTAFAERKFGVVQTVDIDAAYCYRHKGIARTVAGSLRDLLHPQSLQPTAASGRGPAARPLAAVGRRLRVIRGKEDDPFDTFDYILGQQRLHPQQQLLFFALLGDYGHYDKPASYNNHAFRDLLQHLGDFAKVGLHGSYRSSDDFQRIGIETRRLADILHRPIVRNRFHFLRLSLPASYRRLLQYGILHDYTMGFADQPGFRLGTTAELPFYDLSADCETLLHIHPLVVMDTTLRNHLRLSDDQSRQMLFALADEVRDTGGTFCFLVHNQNLCEDFGWQGWRKVYEDLLKYLDSKPHST